MPWRVRQAALRSPANNHSFREDTHESRPLHPLRTARGNGRQGGARSRGRQGPGGRDREGLRHQFPRRPHDPGQISVQTRAALLAGRRSGGHRQARGRRRDECKGGRQGDRLHRFGRHGRTDAGGCGALRADAGQSRFRRGVVVLRHLRHVVSRAARSRASESRRISRRAGCGGRRRPFRRRTRQGDGRESDRGRVERRESRARQEARRR